MSDAHPGTLKTIQCREALSVILIRRGLPRRFRLAAPASLPALTLSCLACQPFGSMHSFMRFIFRPVAWPSGSSHDRPKIERRCFQLCSLPRKEVIQPHLPIRLPCYDFTPVIDLTFVSWLLAVTSLPSGATNSHGVTGGVYKARERIHRGMLIRDY